jgi:crotonobetainyl-CoA:carnitine CoA-transferase CaiB-like acyl-CoA transferase
MSTALFSAFATVNALLRARDTGEGVRVEVSMLDSLLALHGGGVALHLATGEESTRRGCEAPHRAPGNIYKTRDERYVFLVTNNATWPLLCQALELVSLITDPLFQDNQSRVKNRIALNQTLGDRIAQLPLADAVKRLEAANVPHSAVATVAEVLSSEHVKSHEMLLEISGELRDGREPIQVMGIPYKMSAGQPRVRFGPPKLGEANDYVTRDVLGGKLAAKGE